MAQTSTLPARGLLCLALASAMCACMAAEGDASVVTMTTSNFDSLIKEGSWLVKFYAPWCGHCKHLAPIYEEAAAALAGEMQFGEVDATAHGALKTRFDVSGYPTIKFLRDGEVQDYRYPRTLEGFKEFSARMNGPSIHRLGTMSRLKQFTKRSENPVSFVLAKPTVLGQAAEQYQVFKDVSRQLQASHAFGETSLEEFISAYPEYEAPFLVKMEEGEDPIILGHLSSVDSVKEWVLANQFPIVAEISSMNFRDLAGSGRLLAIAVVDPASSKTKPFVKNVRKLARASVSPLPQNVRDAFHFCTLDGKKWDKFVAQFNILPEQLPRMFVFNGESKVFFEDAEVDEFDEIQSFLAEVVQGDVPAQREGIWGLPQRLWRRAVEWYPYSAVGGAAAVLVIALGLWHGNREHEHQD